MKNITKSEILTLIQSNSSNISELLKQQAGKLSIEIVTFLQTLLSLNEYKKLSNANNFSSVGNKKALDNNSSSEKQNRSKKLSDTDRLNLYINIGKKYTSKANRIRKQLAASKILNQKQKNANIGGVMNELEEEIFNAVKGTVAENAPEIEDFEKHMEEVQKVLEISDNSEANFQQMNDSSEIFNTSDYPMPENTVDILANIDTNERKKYSSAFDERVRIDFDIKMKKTTNRIETLTNRISGERIIANTEDLGPKGCRLTWNAFTNIILFVTGYAFPMSRLSKLLGGIFKVSHISRYLDKAAWQLLPVYQYIFENILANSEILNIDDTPVRVNEVTRWRRFINRNKDKPTDALPPWDKYAKKCNAEERSSLFTKSESFLGFQYPMRKKENSFKQALQMTVITGLENANDPKSRVVFYRTHMANAGDLVSKMLEKRKSKNKHLIIQSDLSSANNVTLPSGSEFTIDYAGCAAHCRRVFKRYENHDPEMTEYMLEGFSLISNIEHMIDKKGRNALNTSNARKIAAIPYWVNLLVGAVDISSQWSALTPLGKGAKYLIKNFKKLTYYISNPKISPTNNLAEQLLRYEALEDSSSFGRDTIEGRIRYDIIRSIVATCNFIKVDFRSYLVFNMLAEKDFIKNYPHLFTPSMFGFWLSDKEITSDLIHHGLYLRKLALRAQNIITK